MTNNSCNVIIKTQRERDTTPRVKEITTMKTMRYYELKNRKTNECFTSTGYTFKEACAKAGHNFRNVHLVYSTPIIED